MSIDSAGNAEPLREVASAGTEDENPSEAEYGRLLEAVGRGDRKAEQLLMLRLNKPLRAILRSKIHDPQLAEDICQEALIVVLRAARGSIVKEARALVSFAVETAHRMLLNEARKVQRRKTWAEQDQVEAALDESSNVVADIEQEQLRASVAEVLSVMSNPRDRQVLFAYYLHEEGTKDIQEQHGVDSQQLARILHRARQRFAAIWMRRHGGFEDE